MTDEAIAALERATEVASPLGGLAAWQHDVADLAAQYRTAEPYPHNVLDGALDPEALADAMAEFPAVDSPGWLDYRHVNVFKWANTHPETWGPTLQATARSLMAPPFLRFLEQLTGIESLLPDRSMDGGGLHQTLPGGHLNVHADFTAHHTSVSACACHVEDSADPCGRMPSRSTS